MSNVQQIRADELIAGDRLVVRGNVRVIAAITILGAKVHISVEREMDGGPVELTCAASATVSVVRVQHISAAKAVTL